MSCENIPSLLDLQNAKKNIDDFGRLMGTSDGDSTNEVTGQVRPTFNKVISDMNSEFDEMILSQKSEFNQHIDGMAFTRIGTFESGATLDDMREVLLWDVANGGDGHEYGWTGVFPKIVPPNSTPSSSGGVGPGAWVDRTDVTLRSELGTNGGAGLVGPGVITRGNDKFSIMQGRLGEQFGNDVTRGMGILIADPITGSPPNASTAKINYIRIEDEQLNVVDDAAPGTKVDGLLVSHTFGGSAAKGGRHAGEFILTHNQPTSGVNTDRNYVGLTAWAHSRLGDGGTSDSDVRGAYFGGNFLATLAAGAMYTTNLTGAEFNVSVDAGASTRIRTGLQVGGAGSEQGTVIDAALCVGNKAGAVAWRNGIRISNQNGGQALDTNSKVLVATANTTVQSGFEIPKCSQSILLSGDVDLANGTLTMAAPGSSIEIGSRSTASSVYLDAHTSGNNVDYDARLQFSGGSASTGAGTAALLAGTIQLSSTTEIVMGSTIRPGADNTYDYGTASRRGRTAYFGTGAINTSDAREKTGPLPIDDAVLDAWGDVRLITYKWLDSIRDKGVDIARDHFGVIAQQVRDAFAARGLDGTRYGLLCYDEWDDQYIREITNEGATVTKTRMVKKPVLVTTSREVLVDQELPDGTKVKIAQRQEYQTEKLIQVYIRNEDGSPRLTEDGTQAFVFEAVTEDVEEEYTVPAEPEYVDVLSIPAGSRWGIRPDQCLFLEAAYQRRRCDLIEARLSAIELSI